MATCFILTFRLPFNDWALTYGERPEAKADGRLEGSRNDENCGNGNFIRKIRFVCNFFFYVGQQKKENSMEVLQLIYSRVIDKIDNVDMYKT